MERDSSTMRKLSLLNLIERAAAAAKDASDMESVQFNCAVKRFDRDLSISKYNFDIVFAYFLQTVKKLNSYGLAAAVQKDSILDLSEDAINDGSPVVSDWCSCRQRCFLKHFPRCRRLPEPHPSTMLLIGSIAIDVQVVYCMRVHKNIW